MKPKWLDRDTVRLPYLALALSQDDFDALAAHCAVKAAGDWLNPGADGTTHTWESNGKLTCVVSINVDVLGVDAIDVASLMCHEAVHVVQRMCESIGEESPSKEFQAYSIQRCVEQLMREYVRRTRSAR